MSKGKKRMKLLVFTPHFRFRLKRLRGINNANMIINTITQIRGKTKNATQEQREFER